MSNKDIKDPSVVKSKQESVGDKKIVSNILKQKRKWIDANDQSPKSGQRVVIRLVHETDIDGEDAENIYATEDCQVGIYDTEKKKWTISPPHPKYDYSRLSKHDDINPQVLVTHWAVPIKDDNIDELHGWDTRFDKHMDYKILELKVDPIHEENVYRALLWAANFMARSAGPDFYKEESEMRKMYEYICDLQWAIDQTQYELSDTECRAKKLFSYYLSDAIEEALCDENSSMHQDDYLALTNRFIEEAGGINKFPEDSEFNMKLSIAISNYDGGVSFGGYLTTGNLIQRIWRRTIETLQGRR